MKTDFKTPILYLVFNRPNETQKSFEVLKKVKPKVLYVAADGPRAKNNDDVSKCQKVRDYIVASIDWECEVKTLFRDKNLGCGSAVQGALDWFFAAEEMGIILEDDIIPSLSFFDFASTLLEEYKYNDQIFSINGCNLGYEDQETPYGLTRYFNMWGWATWRRSNTLVKETWKEVDLKKDFKSGALLLASLKLKTIWPQDEWYALWRGHFKRVLSGKLDTWDYQWTYTSLKRGLYAIRPNVNLVTNIGFNEDATHTKQMDTIQKDICNFSKIDLEKEIVFTPKVDPVYELKYVAEKWQHLKLNYKLLYKKVRKKIITIFRF